MTANLSLPSSSPDKTAQVSPLEELNAIRTILFTPKIGTRLLLDEDTRLTLASHLNRLQKVIFSLIEERAVAVAFVDDHPEIGNETRIVLRQMLSTSGTP